MAEFSSKKRNNVLKQLAEPDTLDVLVIGAELPVQALRLMQCLAA
ncbi:hypothetical protein JNUCC1_02961 [Lentibacillus sp. JNUCC-1]|nr:hypothetical protein [Lentibacillus sp. JNUCC-1]